MASETFIVIGAGPAGSFLAYNLAKAGCKVLVFEEHESAGLPVHCTGLFTEKIKDYVNLSDEFLVNTLSSVEIHTQNSKVLLKSNEYVVNRAKFDEYLHKEAESLGVKYYFNHKLSSYEKRGSSLQLVFETPNGVEKFDCSTIIGCDGPLSKVNELFNMNPKGEFYLGKQFLIKTSIKKISCYGVFFGGELSDFFGWIVPVDNTHIKIGVGSTIHSLVNKKLRSIRKSLNIKGKVVEVNAGLIPIYNPYREIYKKIGRFNVYLMGDAAGFVKATSGGGVIPSFSAITECYKNIIHGEYPKLPKTRRELLSHLIIRRVMTKLSDSEWDMLIKDFDDKRVRYIISRQNRDNLLKLALELVKSKPYLLKYARFLPKMF
ncbi:Digeranylgeranylglycerophospholipid reductase [Candidatus Tiddalikarchaeum anstoanum]|nr:Digeranylgeranylglycerophospholipid reductase [Candidatus Tiddalikarchaeum anstoanum]